MARSAWVPYAFEWVRLLKCHLKGKTCRKLANGQDVDYSEKNNGHRASSATLLFSIIFKHVYWYIQRILGSVYRTIGPLVISVLGRKRSRESTSRQLIDEVTSTAKLNSQTQQPNSTGKLNSQTQQPNYCSCLLNSETQQANSKANSTAKLNRQTTAVFISTAKLNRQTQQPNSTAKLNSQTQQANHSSHLGIFFYRKTQS